MTIKIHKNDNSGDEYVALYISGERDNVEQNVRDASPRKPLFRRFLDKFPNIYKKWFFVVITLAVVVGVIYLLASKRIDVIEVINVIKGLA